MARLQIDLAFLYVCIDITTLPQHMIIFVVLSLIHAHVNKHTKDNFTTVFVCTVIRTAEIHYYTCFRIADESIIDICCYESVSD